MRLAIVVLSVFVGNALAWGGYKINFEYSDLEYDESLLTLDVQMKRVDEKTYLNVRAEQFDDMEDPIVVHVSHFERVNNQYQHLINSSVSVCNVMSRVKSHPILRIIMKELLKSSNFPTNCPVKKGIYYMKDFTLNDELLPPFLPIGNFMSQVRVERLVDGDEASNSLIKFTLNIDIDYAKERKSYKLF